MHCAVCNKVSTTRCSKCKSEHYCSRACQAEHWKEHKLVCKEAPRTPLCGQGFRKWLAARENQWLKKTRLREEPLVGFSNWRNNCYLNAVYQCLLHTPFLKESILAACPNPQDVWLAELTGLYKLIEQAKAKSDDCNTYVDPPARLGRLIADASSEFIMGRQADAHEAFIVLIERWLAGCLTAGDGSGNDLSKEKPAQKELLEASSLVGHIFGFNLGQVMRCESESCPYESWSHKVEYCLVLHVTLGMTEDELTRCRQDSLAQFQQWRRRPSGGGSGESSVSSTTLEALMDEYTKQERIDEWRCEKCKHLGGRKRHFVQRRPNILTVYIDRHQDCNLFGKINRRVEFPETFDLGPWLDRDPKAEDDEEEDASASNGGDPHYSLFAMCVHQDRRGNTAAGHYIAFVKDDSDSWYLIDDERVRRVPWSAVQEEHPHLLFYAISKPQYPPRSTPPKPAAATEKQPEESPKSPVAKAKKKPPAGEAGPATEPEPDGASNIGSSNAAGPASPPRKKSPAKAGKKTPEATDDADEGNSALEAAASVAAAVVASSKPSTPAKRAGVGGSSDAAASSPTRSNSCSPTGRAAAAATDADDGAKQGAVAESETPSEQKQEAAAVEQTQEPAPSVAKEEASRLHGEENPDDMNAMS